MNLNRIRDALLDEAASREQLHSALDTFSAICSQTTGVRADPSFDAWADDAFLENGVAINPQAAAHCVKDYARSVAFIRGVSAAIETLQLRFPDTSLEILYAGCGPFATLVLPLLGRFTPGDLSLHLLDVHQRSLDSVSLLIEEFGLGAHNIQLIKADACNYDHPRALHLVVAETMQKSLEQEPQFAVTANLAPQLHAEGVFIPQRIEVRLCLADIELEQALIAQAQKESCLEPDNPTRDVTRYSLGILCNLSAEQAFDQMQAARVNVNGEAPALQPTIVEIPRLKGVAELDAALFTRIDVFEQYALEDYESQITLPLRCAELSPLVVGERYRIVYQFGNYPKFDFERIPSASP
ncbi:hypothetical protein [Marinobacter alexandrii]|uniref:hypothetical protein n=1 Tax=Marinobacter alexandrii TaxID=2570351 RepID=UPI00329714BE